MSGFHDRNSWLLLLWRFAGLPIAHAHGLWALLRARSSLSDIAGKAAGTIGRAGAPHIAPEDVQLTFLCTAIMAGCALYHGLPPYPILPRASSPHHAVNARAPTQRKSPSKSAIPEVVVCV